MSNGNNSRTFQPNRIQKYEYFGTSAGRTFIVGTGNASEFLTQHVQKALQYLDLKAKSKEKEQVCLSRVYTRGRILQQIVFHDGSTSITPRYKSSTDITQLYDWTSSYLINKSDNSVDFKVVVPSVSKKISVLQKNCRG